MNCNAKESKRHTKSKTFSLAGVPYSTSTKDGPDEQITRIPVIQQRIPCPACPKTFKRTNHLRRHVREMKDDSHRAFWLVLNGTQCLKCREHFKSSAGLKKHKRFPCKSRTFINTSVSQGEFVGYYLGKIAWEEDSRDDQDRGPEGAQQSFASNDKMIQEKTEKKNCCPIEYPRGEYGQPTIANTIPWTIEGWNDATYLHSSNEQDGFATVNPVSLTTEDWDNAVYHYSTATTVPWPTRNWGIETHSRTSEERQQFAAADTIPWPRIDWDDAIYQSTTANMIPWSMKDLELEAYLCIVKEQNLDSAAHHLPISNTIP